MASYHLLDSLMLLFPWVVSVILVGVIAIFGWKRTKPCLPPSPQALPIIGHMHHLTTIVHQSFHKLSNRYGPLVHIFIGSNPCVIVSSPDIAKQILQTHEKSFLNRPKMANLDYLTYGSADFTFAPYGPYWKFIKKLCMTELLGGRTLERLSHVRSEELKMFLKSMQEKAEEGAEVNVGKELMRLANNIISRMALSRRCSDKDDEADDVRKLVREMTQLAGKFNLSDSIWFCQNLDIQGFQKRLRDVRDRYDVMMERIIKEHQVARKQGCGRNEVKDLLDILLEIYEDPSSEIRLTRENIKAFIMNIFGAGTDTSSITIEWALAELINHPDVMKKAREEIELVVGKNRILSESDILNLPYLQAIVKETLRLHPTGPLVVRESTEDCKINGYDIPARTRVFINVWALGRDPTHWESPLMFKPERFVSSLEGLSIDVRGQSFQMLPFGSGKRGCPGTSLALHVVQTTLGAMIQCFDWKSSIGIVDMEEAPGVSLPRAHPLMCLPVARFDPLPIT